MSSLQNFAAVAALAIIALIGLDLLLRRPARREDRGGRATLLPDGVDPASLRRRRPLTQRLSGAVLIAAVIVLWLAIHPALGLG